MAGRDTALVYARQLREALLDHGVPAVSIELQVGRPSYGGYGGDDWTITAEHMVGAIAHHTVSSYRPDSLTPVLALCKTGRSDVDGPLPNGYGGWDLIYRVITCGMANHSGYGGPLTVPTAGGAFLIPADSGRAWLWGTEYEGGISVADWDRELICPRNGKRMTHREFQGRSNAAILDWQGLDVRCQGEHKTWAPDRKVDRLNVTTDGGRADTAQWLKGSGGKTPSAWATGDVYLSKLTVSQTDSDSVRRLQFRLRTNRTAPTPALDVTGNYGDATRDAARKWQRTLKATGVDDGSRITRDQAERLFGANYRLIVE